MWQGNAREGKSEESLPERRNEIMAKLPRYIIVSPMYSRGNNLYVDMRIKWWGMPIIILKRLAELCKQTGER